MAILDTEFHFTWIFTLVVKTETQSSNRNFCFCSLSLNGTKKKDTCILFFYLTFDQATLNNELSLECMGQI